MPQDKYRFLHLSDIHFGQERSGVLRVYDDIRAQLVRDCAECTRRSGIPTDGILITGDVAFKGAAEEYRVAGQWIDEIATAAGCDILKVRTIPGNHDIDRKKIHHACTLGHAEMKRKTPAEVDDCLAQLLEEGEASPILRKISAYREFASRFGCDFESPTRPIWRRDYEFTGGGRLAFVGMNSVQVSDANDAEGQMVLGNKQYILPEEDGVEYIALVHHPLNWFKDRAEVERFLMMRARVVVVGHEHLLRVQKVSDMSGAEQLQIYAGAATPPEQELDFRYNWLEMSLEDNGATTALKVAVEPRLWDRNTKRFNLDHARAQGNSVIQIACPRFKDRAAFARQVAALASHKGSESETMPKNHDTQVDFDRLQYFFWTHLGWNERLRALVEADILPTLPSQPMPQTLEHIALDTARRDGKLAKLWDVVMPYVPQEKRTANPFV